MSESIPDALRGERLDRAISLLWGCSRSTAAGLMEAGAVRLNGVVAKRRSERLSEGDVIEVSKTALSGLREQDAPLADVRVEFPVLCEEGDFLVINKPAGLVVHPGSGRSSATLCSGLLARYPEIAEVGDRTRPGIVHRLDKGTTGLMVVARTPRGYESLVGQFSKRSVRRLYEVVCWGATGSSGVIDAPVGRSSRRPTLMAVSARGREARTHYELQQCFDAPDALSWLRCRLETGRTHQIRVHLSSIGHPVVGDRAYGAPSAGNRGKDGAVSPLSPLTFPRPALHSSAISFVHPATGETVNYSAKLPEDFASLLGALS